MRKEHIKICIVQPILAPYWIDRVRAIATEQDFELSLLLERKEFSHRPGWQLEEIQ